VPQAPIGESPRPHHGTGCSYAAIEVAFQNVADNVQLADIDELGRRAVRQLCCSVRASVSNRSIATTRFRVRRLVIHRHRRCLSRNDRRVAGRRPRCRRVVGPEAVVVSAAAGWDLVAGVAFLKTRSEVNPKRTGIADTPLVSWRRWLRSVPMMSHSSF
jgi:hypothetical protein